jgi:hypothetical protein
MFTAGRIDTVSIAPDCHSNSGMAETALTLYVVFLMLYNRNSSTSSFNILFP